MKITHSFDSDSRIELEQKESYNWRSTRLLQVLGLVHNGSKDNFDSIVAVEDHEGMLTVELDEENEQLERAFKDGWEAVGEVAGNVSCQIVRR